MSPRRESTTREERRSKPAEWRRRWPLEERRAEQRRGKEMGLPPEESRAKDRRGEGKKRERPP